jgi:hypothetical protein
VLCAATLAGCGAVSGSEAPGRPAPASVHLTSATPGADVVAATDGSTSAVVAAPIAAVSAPRAAAVIRAVGAAQWSRMVAVGMVRPGCPARRTTLRRVEVGYWGFDGAVHRGVLVVNADVAASVVAILTRLFEARFPIRSMRPMEDFRGDDNASMRADNTSAYNCRSASQANAPATRSPHANGRAIDLNPRENPWRDPRCHCWQPSARYAVHRTGDGVIVVRGVVWRAFAREGWIWQDSATPDFQHFDTGYPSRPWHRPA